MSESLNDPGQAWHLVEEVIREGHDVKIEYHSGNCWDGPTWEVEFRRYDDVAKESFHRIKKERSIADAIRQAYRSPECTFDQHLALMDQMRDNDD